MWGPKCESVHGHGRVCNGHATSVASDAGDDDPGNTGSPHLSVDRVVESGRGQRHGMTIAGVVQTVQNGQGTACRHSPQRQVDQLLG